jgi:hypothetical protein
MAESRAIMLIEIWERLRGYDKWPIAEATIESSKLDEVAQEYSRVTGNPLSTRWQGDEELVWRDQSGTTRRESIAVGENSPLFQLYEGKPLTVRYNPSVPPEFYVREQLQFQVNRTSKVITCVVAGVSLIVALAVIFLHD